MLTGNAKPVLFVVDGAIDITGAVISAARQAEITRVDVITILALPISNEFRSQVGLRFRGVIRLPIRSLRKSLESLAAYIPALLVASVRLKRAMRRVHCTRLQINDFNLVHGSLLRLLGYRGRIVTWVRFDPKRHGLVGRIWLALARWSSDELVVVSKFIASRVPPHYRATLIYDAVPPVLEVQRSASRQLLFVGNYIEGKGQAEAIQAFHRIAAQFPEAELLFHGSDMGLAKNRDYRANLNRIADTGDGKRRIHLRDFVEDTNAAYQGAYAAINFSHSESFSLTCLEASAHGLAVIATRCGGPEEIVEDGVTGFLVPVGDVEAMAARMADLLSDPPRAAAMGEAGRRLVNERFDTAKFRQQVMEILDLH